MEDPEEHFANWREEGEENRDVLEDREVLNELFGEANDDEAEEVPAPRTTQMIDLPTEDVTKVKKPKRVMLKLDLEKLFSERGLEAVEKHVSVVKIRGKGHELEDLTNICKAYEHWAHRLYPKMRCEDVLEKVEVLGMKNQTKCRMHKAVLYQKHRRLNDIMGKNSDDDDDAAWPEPDQNQPSENNSMFGDSSFGQNPSLDNSQNVSSSFGGNNPFTPNNSFTAPPPTPPTPTTLSEEQKERMRQNRIKALERKRNSMPSAAPAPTSTPLNEADQLPATNVTERPLAKDSEEVESDTVVESKRLKLSDVESEMDVDEFTEGTIDPDIANEINDLIG